jgi:hypothetical protein
MGHLKLFIDTLSFPLGDRQLVAGSDCVRLHPRAKSVFGKLLNKPDYIAFAVRVQP